MRQGVRDFAWMWYNVGMKPFVYALAALIAVVLWFYVRSDAARIRRMFSEIERIARRENQENVLEGAARAQALASYFDSECHITLPEYGVCTRVSRPDIAGTILTYRNDASTLSVRFESLRIKVEAGQASVEGTVDFTGSSPFRGFIPPYKRHFEAELKEIDEKWRFSQFYLAASDRSAENGDFPLR